LKITIKFKDTITVSHLKEVKQKAQEIGIRIFENKNEIDTRKYILSKEFVALVRAKMHSQINKMVVGGEESSKPQKFWVECMGNNHNLVKAIIWRRRWFVWQDLSSVNEDWSLPQR
jgi:hypothetical protein